VPLYSRLYRSGYPRLFRGGASASEDLLTSGFQFEFRSSVAIWKVEKLRENRIVLSVTAAGICE